MTIHFRHINGHDVIPITEYVTNKKVTRFLTRKTYQNHDDTMSFIQYASKCIAYPNEFLAIIYGHKLIGTIHILAGEEYTKIGFGIVPKQRGKGLGVEIVKELLTYIKSSSWHQTSHILAEVHKDNLAAIHVLQKTAFKLLEQGHEQIRVKYVFTCQ